MDNDGFLWTVEPWGRALRSRAVAHVADHFFTSLPMRFRGDDGEEERDWRRAAEGIGVAPNRLTRLEQVHGNRVVVIRRADPGNEEHGPKNDSSWPRADILVSDDAEVALAVQVADCVPLLLADPVTGAVAAAHAGWRGTALDVAGTAVAALVSEFGARASDLRVAQGPSIGPCCYTVGEELLDEFGRGGYAEDATRWFSTDGDGRLRLDLWLANRDQLLRAGVLPENISQARLCTASHPGVFPSYRRDGRGTGRIAAVIRARG